MTLKLIIFSILSLLLVSISWRTLFNVKTHGFYRFFGWECMAWLFASNHRFWFVDPFGVKQLVSWILLIYSAYLVVAGLLVMRRKGKASSTRDEKNLFGFEKTTELIDTGVFKRIRHPLYSSLVVLTFGIFLKNPTVDLLVISLIATILFYITSKYDERECINYFGEPYLEYMKRTNMFIPFVF